MKAPSNASSPFDSRSPLLCSMDPSPIPIPVLGIVRPVAWLCKDTIGQ